MTQESRWGLTVRPAGAESEAVAVRGRLSRANAPRLVEAVESAIAAGKRQITLDFRGVDYVSSTGLQALGELSARLEALGGGLVLTEVQPPVRIALELAGLRLHATGT
jgi:anti-anti-sigma factor